MSGGQRIPIDSVSRTLRAQWNPSWAISDSNGAENHAFPGPVPEPFYSTNTRRRPGLAEQATFRSTDDPEANKLVLLARFGWRVIVFQLPPVQASDAPLRSDGNARVSHGT